MVELAELNSNAAFGISRTERSRRSAVASILAKEGSGINNNTDVVNVRVLQQSQKMANRKAWIKSAISMYAEVFETLGEDPRTMHLGPEERRLVAGQLASACMISNEIAKLRTEMGQATDDIGR